jgi:hypothetical protein
MCEFSNGSEKGVFVGEVPVESGCTYADAFCYLGDGDVIASNTFYEFSSGNDGAIV